MNVGGQGGGGAGEEEGMCKTREIPIYGKGAKS